MSKRTTNITTNNSNTIVYSFNTARNGRGSTKIRGYVSGTFDSGTVTVKTTIDGGSNYFNEKSGGSDITLTSAGYFELDLACVVDAGTKPIELAVGVTGATNPNLNVVVFDGE